SYVSSWGNLAGAALKLAHGHPARLPVIFFLITLVFSAIGPGNIAGTAMIAPIGMAVAARAGINPLLMAIMICTGANAGAFSPIALTGLINVGLMHDIGVDDPTAGWKIFVAVAVLQSVSALAAYVVFGGYRTRTASPVEAPGPIGVGGPSGVNIATDRAHLLTFVAMGVLITMVLVFKMNTAVAALLMATVLALVGAGSAEEALRTLPWSVIVMVSGISVLIGLVESTGGLDLATAAIASISTPGTINTVLALITGIVSMFSSSSGVVLPTFI
ncbi:MAG TPA: SLC13 family permease, partial [Anaerolineales bacterium]|nr:SLC13 family permease [Anaerolineales bacterium]